MGVHAFLVTGDNETRRAMWQITATYANWLEGRGRPERPGETWQVMVFDEQAEHFLSAARRVGATVEEIDGAGDDERYVLRVGEPGTGWQR
jgi:hypothetical protein